MSINWDKLTTLINTKDNILLSTHINPDADGLGSEIAMYEYLTKLKKNVRIINISKLPDKYKFLDNDNVIEYYNKKDHYDWISNCECAIIFDIGNYKRLGEISKLIASDNIYKASIDHHPSDDIFFDIKFLDVNAPATGFLLWQYLKHINVDLNYNMGVGLYSALITDTGSFRYNSTTPDCHIMAKEILDIGIKPYDIFSEIYEQRTLPQIKLLAEVINSINIKDEFASIKITKEMLEKCKATLDDIDGFTDFTRSIKGVEVSFMISQISNVRHRINFRSRGKYIINDIAKSFDGGGHKLAAGAIVENLSISDIEQKIFNYLYKKKEDYVD